jgi:hypothetical protein
MQSARRRCWRLPGRPRLRWRPCRSATGRFATFFSSEYDANGPSTAPLPGRIPSSDPGPCRAGWAEIALRRSSRDGSSRPMAVRQDVAGFGVLEVAQDLGESRTGPSRAPRSRCRRRAPRCRRSVAPRRSRGRADGRQQHAHDDHRDRPSAPSRAPAPREREPEHHQREVLRRPEQQRERGQRRGEGRDQQRGDGARDERGDRGDGRARCRRGPGGPSGGRRAW